jgi:hypothetical protein
LGLKRGGSHEQRQYTNELQQVFFHIPIKGAARVFREHRAASFPLAQIVLLGE